MFYDISNLISFITALYLTDKLCNKCQKYEKVKLHFAALMGVNLKTRVELNKVKYGN